MKIPVFILSLAVGALLAVNGWTLQKVVQLGEDVAAIKATLSLRETAQR